MYLITTTRFIDAVRTACKMSAEFRAVVVKVAEVRRAGTGEVEGYVLFMTCVPVSDDKGQYLYQEVGRFQYGQLVSETNLWTAQEQTERLMSLAF